jgi:outer membrane murein-binding lipoprotein Lpp
MCRSITTRNRGALIAAAIMANCLLNGAFSKAKDGNSDI